jgi:hypothetical protein
MLHNRRDVIAFCSSKTRLHSLVSIRRVLAKAWYDRTSTIFLASICASECSLEVSRCIERKRSAAECSQKYQAKNIVRLQNPALTAESIKRHQSTSRDIKGHQTTSRSPPWSSASRHLITEWNIQNRGSLPSSSVVSAFAMFEFSQVPSLRPRAPHEPRCHTHPFPTPIYEEGCLRGAAESQVIR